MCGIAGIARRDGRPVTADELSSMCAALAHRGPDDEGAYLGAGVGIGMRRLSIIDLATGQQPIGNEDGTVWVVLQRRDLQLPRAAARARGARPPLPHAQRHRDHRPPVRGARRRGCVDRLRGMFAFALWDERRRRAAARARSPRHQAALLRRGRRTPRLRLRAEGAPRTRRCGDASSTGARSRYLFTFLRHARRPEPSSRACASCRPATAAPSAPDGRASVAALLGRRVRAGSPPDASATPSSRAARAAARTRSRCHLVSDVPVGAFSRGGVDSSAVVGTMARLGSRAREDLLHRLRRSQEYDELALRAAGRAPLRHRPPRAGGRARRAGRCSRDLAWYPRRAVRRRRGDPHLPRLAARGASTSRWCSRATAATSCSPATTSTEARGARRRYDRLPAARRAGRSRRGARVLPDGARAQLPAPRLASIGAAALSSTPRRSSGASAEARLFAPDVRRDCAARHDPLAEKPRTALGARRRHWLSAL